MSTASRPFYIAGGTLRRDARCYVARRADEELHDALAQGKFCYVLTTRQMGKSSLMVRVADLLKKGGNTVAPLDLSRIDRNVTSEVWYNSLLSNLGERLGIEEVLDAYTPPTDLGPLMRWMRAVRELVLPRCPNQLVIFIDEIDIVRSLPFSTDEFFAGIRDCYNRRSLDPEFERLTFCLLGVATPQDLIQDSRTTPFNIGSRIDLDDFRLEEMMSLAEGLGRDPATADRLLRRVYYWTGGHPYLTQRFCEALSHRPAAHSDSDVDRLCQELFLSAGAREKDDNLIFARTRVLSSGDDLANVLNLYEQVRCGRPVRDDESNPNSSILRLSGIVRRVDGRLVVRNRIFRAAFDRKWVRSNMPGAEVRRQKLAFWRGFLFSAAVTSIIVGTTGWGLFVSQKVRGLEQARDDLTAQKSRLVDIAKKVRRGQSKFMKELPDEVRVGVQNEVRKDVLFRLVPRSTLNGISNRILDRILVNTFRSFSEQYEQIVEKYPDEPLMRSGLGSIYFDLGRIQREAGNETEARLSFEKAVINFQKEVDIERVIYQKAPNDSTYRQELSEYYGDLARAQRELGRIAEALATAVERARLWKKNTAPFAPEEARECLKARRALGTCTPRLPIEYATCHPGSFAVTQILVMLEFGDPEESTPSQGATPAADAGPLTSPSR